MQCPLFAMYRSRGASWWLSSKGPTCNAGDLGLTPWSGRFPWRRVCQPTPVFLPGESHGQRSLVGYSPRGHKEWDMTKVTEHACTILGIFCCLSTDTTVNKTA